MAESPSQLQTEELGKRIRVHKNRSADGGVRVSNPTDEQIQAALSQRSERTERALAEIIPALASAALGDDGALGTEGGNAARFREAFQQRAVAEERELQDIYDMSIPHPLDTAPPAEPWQNLTRPVPKKIVLSHYQYEMINYQRMLLRKNIWYYRDRMNVARGPCPLHVLKDCWVQGVIDENTMVWGHGLYDWLPAKNVKLLMPMILTPEVKLGAWIKQTFAIKPALNRIHKLQRESEKRAAAPASETSKQ